MSEPARAASRLDARLRLRLRLHHATSVVLERELVLAAQGGDAVAREQLVRAFLPSIAIVARRYRNSSAVERRELMQEGVVGLLRALARFDSSLGTPFWAYASWWVRQAMQRLMAELGRPVVLSDRALRQIARVKDAQHRLFQDLGKEPSAAELAAETSFTTEQVGLLMAAERRPRILEESAGQERSGGGEAVGRQLADSRVEEEFERRLWQLASEQLSTLAQGLTDRERGVLRARFGLDGREQTLREIAARIGLSAERVRQIEQEALGKMRVAAGVEPAG
jgi:RNA polymerase primary sigma factor